MQIPGCCTRLLVSMLGCFHDVILAWKNWTESCRPPSAPVMVEDGQGIRTDAPRPEDGKATRTELH